MTKTVYKYELRSNCDISMPIGAKILTVWEQNFALLSY